jgi:glycosyltransferase involved in cell wall biosynthesis
MISIIVPVYNEIKFIDKLIESLESDNSVESEILLVDGGSEDGTIERILHWQSRYPNIKLIRNAKRYVSHGFNLAYNSSSGEYIAFIGAHASYPPNYFSKAISYIRTGKCDVVGGPLRQEGRSVKEKAIAYCMSSRFGVGGTEFRTSVKEQYVQSVAFAVYRREVFQKSGLMDEQLIRNQDDEFHYRINSIGFRILMVPELRCTYFVRDSIKKLYSQYFYYGFYKPLVLIKVHSGLRLRHIIPSAFVFYILTLPLTLIFKFWSLPLMIYFALNIFVSIRSPNSIVSSMISFVVFPVLHTSYGMGFILGVIKWVIKK